MEISSLSTRDINSVAPVQKREKIMGFISIASSKNLFNICDLINEKKKVYQLGLLEQDRSVDFVCYFIIILTRTH